MSVAGLCLWHLYYMCKKSEVVVGRLLTALHVGNDIALVDACTLLGVNLN